MAGAGGRAAQPGLRVPAAHARRRHARRAAVGALPAPAGLAARRAAVRPRAGSPRGADRPSPAPRAPVLRVPRHRHPRRRAGGWHGRRGRAAPTERRQPERPRRRRPADGSRGDGMRVRRAADGLPRDDLQGVRVHERAGRGGLAARAGGERRHRGRGAGAPGVAVRRPLRGRRGEADERDRVGCRGGGVPAGQPGAAHPGGGPAAGPEPAASGRRGHLRRAGRDVHQPAAGARRAAGTTAARLPEPVRRRPQPAPARPRDPGRAVRRVGPRGPHLPRRGHRPAGHWQPGVGRGGPGGRRRRRPVAGGLAGHRERLRRCGQRGGVGVAGVPARRRRPDRRTPPERGAVRPFPGRAGGHTRRLPADGGPGARAGRTPACGWDRGAGVQPQVPRGRARGSRQRRRRGAGCEPHGRVPADQPVRVARGRGPADEPDLVVRRGRGEPNRRQALVRAPGHAGGRPSRPGCGRGRPGRARDQPVQHRCGARDRTGGAPGAARAGARLGPSHHGTGECDRRGAEPGRRGHPTAGRSPAADHDAQRGRRRGTRCGGQLVGGAGWALAAPGQPQQPAPARQPRAARVERSSWARASAPGAGCWPRTWPGWHSGAPAGWRPG